jgi:hypothetical protein
MFRPMFVSCLTMAIVAGCGIESEPAVELADDYVFGLSADEVLAAKRVAGQSFSDEDWLDLHRGAFRCDRYGDLCAMIGPAAAARTIELGYQLALDGADGEAILAAQNAAIAEARSAWRQLDIAVYDSDTETTPGSGADNLRLSATAWADRVFPYVRLQARAECSTQVYFGGIWWWSDSDDLCGSMTATFNDDPPKTRSDRCVHQASSLTFTPFETEASHLTTVVRCRAANGLWTAQRTSNVSI